MALILSMQVPFVGFQPIRTSEHMASAGMIDYENYSLLYSTCTCSCPDIAWKIITLNDFLNLFTTFN